MSTTCTNSAPSIADIKSTMKQNGYFNATRLCETLQGSIWSAIKPDTKQSVIIKVTSKRLHKTQIVNINGHKYHVQENILKERALLKYLTVAQDAPKEIVKYIDWFTDDTNYYLIEENGGTSLFDFVAKVHKYLAMAKIEISEWHKLVQILFKQMVNAVDYMHSKNVSHFDISLENMLINDIDVSVDNEDNLTFIMNDCKNPVQIKFCDFGLAELFAMAQNGKCSFLTKKKAGKKNYKSPEMIANKKVICAASNDVWCLGVCLFMLLIGGSPWQKAEFGSPNFDIVMKGEMAKILKKWNRENYVNEELVNLLNSIFQPEHQRITISELKQHPWLK